MLFVYYIIFFKIYFECLHYNMMYNIYRGLSVNKLRHFDILFCITATAVFTDYKTNNKSIDCPARERRWIIFFILWQVQCCWCMYRQ